MSSDESRIDLTSISRRKLLGGMATIGAAGALGGTGTMAFFSDEEEFANNRLVAGELDLKVDWEEHYSDWMGEEQNHAEMADPEDADYLLPAVGFQGFPGADATVGAGIQLKPSEAKPIALNFTTSQDDFWDATSIEAYPDDDGDGIQDQDADGDPVFPEADSICETDSDMDAALDSELRTEGSRGEPLISLEDVKPGDFGEVTFSMHLCDNPGYIWMTGELVEASENGITEPESKDEDEDGDADSTDPDDVELLDNVLARVWRDDGNNQVDTVSGELDVVCAIDTSGSLSSNEIGQLETGVNDFIDALDASGADVQVGTLEFGGGSIEEVNTLTDPGPLDVSLPGVGSGNTPLPGALDIGDQMLYGPGSRAGAEKVLVVFTDGGPNYQNTSYSGGGFSAPRDDSADWSADSGDNEYDNQGSGTPTGQAGNPGGQGQVTEGEMDETALVAGSIKSGSVGDGETRIVTVYVGDDNEQRQAMTENAVSAYDTLILYLENNIASVPADALNIDLVDLGDVAEDLAEIVATAEDVFFLGTLRQALDVLSSGNGHPLQGDIEAAQGGGTGTQGCFEPSNTHHIGFEWWLPVDHANQIQSDSVIFNLGFYTEQCRHNDGNMPPTETPQPQ